MRTSFLPCIAIGVSFAASGGVASAAVNLTFNGTGFGVYPASLIYPVDNVGNSATRTGIFIGELLVTPASGSTIRTYCLSPAGTVASGPYDLLSFEGAKFGKNPVTWSPSGGIENASYLYNQLAGAVADNDHGAAMQLALLELVYDSTGVGSVTAGGMATGRFKSLGVNPVIVSEADAFVNQVIGAGPAAIGASYAAHPIGVYRPQDPHGQDLITFFVPVPELGTFWAGGILLLAPLFVLRLNRARA